MAKTLIVSDESLNSYGFRVLNAGIQLDRFKKNPIGLFNHDRYSDDYAGPICKWSDLKIGNGQITAVPDFDQNDPFAKTIGDKVENGYLNAASIGIRILETSIDPKYLIPGQTYPTVTKCELREISIADIPSNENAVCLYDDDEVISLKEGFNLNSIMQPITNLNNNSDMNKFPMAVLVLLGLTENATEVEVVTAITNLKTDAAQVATLKAESETQTKTRIEGMVQLAIDQRKIKAADKDTYIALGTANEENTKKILDGMTAQKSVSERINLNTDGGDGTNGKTFSELRKTHLPQLLKLKEDDVETYNKLVAGATKIDPSTLPTV